MKHRITIGIVGCGAHAQIAYIPVFKKNPYCTLFAICDTDMRKIDYLSTKYSIPHKYQDFQEIVENPDIDALVIATPNYLHAPMTIAALRYGKHVLCETPMAINLRDAALMVKTKKDTGKKLCLAMNNRLRPDVQAIRQFINEGELGEIYYVKAGWLIGTKEWILDPWRFDQLKSGGGAFLGLGTTLLDISLYLLRNKKPVALFASLHKKEPATDVEDTSMCMITFSDNTLLTIEVNWSLLFEKDFLYCNVFGRKGAALVNPFTINKELHGDLFNITPSLGRSSVYKESYEQQAHRFIDYLTKDTVPPITYEDGLMIARIAEAFYKSAQKQKLVRI